MTPLRRLHVLLSYNADNQEVLFYQCWPYACLVIARFFLGLVSPRAENDISQHETAQNKLNTTRFRTKFQWSHTWVTNPLEISREREPSSWIVLAWRLTPRLGSPAVWQVEFSSLSVPRALIPHVGAQNADKRLRPSFFKISSSAMRLTVL